MKRFLATIVTLLVTAAATTSGVGARCLMDGDEGHCAACPDGATTLRAPLDCPMIYSASPESGEAVEHANPPVVVAILGEPVVGVRLAAVPGPSTRARAPYPAARPPGHAVLRI